MAEITFDVALFRQQFPQFTVQVMSDADLQMQFDTAILYISNQYGGCYFSTRSIARKARAVYLMTAHLAAISLNIASGQNAGVMTGATVDKTSITLEAPPLKNQWQYWLQTTPYGQQLLALLQIAAAGGAYIGGRPELAAFSRPPAFWC